MLTDRELGARVRMLRKTRSITQERLAEMIDVTCQQISRYETGSDRMTPVRLQALAAALEVPVGTLFGEEGEVPMQPLSVEEIRLVQGYRRLNKTEQRFVLRSVECK